VDTKKPEKKKQKEEEATGAAPAHLQPKQLPPNNILFVENLPEQTSELMLSMLFQQYVSILFFHLQLNFFN
jgi:U2 small nuclear ribonucleoprotein B''